MKLKTKMIENENEHQVKAKNKILFEKSTKIEVLSKINFLHPNQNLINFYSIF